MKRIIYMVFKNTFSAIYLWVKLCYYAKHVEKYTEEQRYMLLRKIVSKANSGGRVHIDIHGEENIPKEKGFMFFPNHQGLYDVLAIADACSTPFSVVAKKEVQNVPFLKQVFSCMNAYLIDRNDIRQAMQVIVDVTKEVQNGKNYLIFPEGTRSKQGNKVGEFKGGSFKAAMKAKCPIVPIALVDAYIPFDRNTIEPVTVQVHFLEPLVYDQYKDMKSVEIAKCVQDRIVNTIQSSVC
ncbi:MAG: lysophospholipid acyltransferase family protein [Lachnospiraceae bacterium]